MAPTDFVEDDRMEVDHFDAMLAGSSRSKARRSTTKKSQPRITHAFDNERDGRADFAEEGRAARRAGTSASHVKRSRQRARRQTARKPSALLLSIVDAPTSPSESMPQFVKLAMRRARGQKQNGRHSPTRKHIRLATERDTEDATSILQAWREGTVPPRQGPRYGERHYATKSSTEKSPGLRPADDDEQRLPLSELSANQQGRLPKALRTIAARQTVQTGAKRLSVPRPKMRQSRLQPVTLNGDPASEQPDTTTENDSIGAPDGRRGQCRRPQPRPSESRYRGAQLETLKSDFDRGHRAAAFERRMHTLTENVVRGSFGRTPAAPVQLERFLYDLDAAQPRSGTRDRPQYEPTSEMEAIETPRESVSHRRLVRRPRKRVPQRLDAEARHYRQPSEPLPDVVCVNDEPVNLEQDSTDGPVLQGLGPFGTRYALDFDTLPLLLGTYFHESSFIGSGDFAASLNFAGRNLDLSTGRIRIHVDADILDLGMWNEEVAVGLAKIPPAVSNALSSLAKHGELQGIQDSPDVVLANVNYLLRSTVRYFTRCLAFSDPIDRCACIRSLQQFVEDTIEAATEHSLMTGPHKDLASRCLQYAVALARQAVQLSNHTTVPSDLVQRSQQMLQKVASRLARDIVQTHLGELRTLYEDLRQSAKREAGIRDTDTAISSITVLHRVLNGMDSTRDSFWTILYQSMDVHTERLASVSALDRIWCNVFTVLPALEIDSRGILQLGKRFQDAKEDWSLPKALVERLFQLYSASSALPGSTINDYVRATLTRCSRLQSRWGWCRCEPMLYSISDFFARRGLAQLHKEESRGSPVFLQELNQQPFLEVHADDRSFHIFLKMLASGLQNMRGRSIYPDKKIGGIAWRFIPNHGRTHRKDVDVRQEDLDALRNHHDLLCTIYYASPPNNRLRVDLIQHLVDHATSHREACRLNVRAWRNLAAFQAPNDEAVERLRLFNSWFQDLLAANIMQFRQAKTEIEQDAKSAEASGKPEVSRDVIDSIIAANQRQISATIIDALAAVKHVVKFAGSIHAASTVIEGTVSWQVFDLFDPAARRMFGMFDEGLEVIKTAIEVQKRFQAEGETQGGSDDSQDYGDSSALQELASTQAPPQTSGINILDILHTHVADFVSGVFGADGMSDDALLTKVIDVWVEVAGFAVSQGKKDWQNYISSYGSEAWSQLRDTEQRRKYTPYFLARVAGHDQIRLVETGILTFWLKSLVEREATLKFQHTLTNALLNRQHGEPLLANLPFVRPRDGEFNVSLHKLRQSRLGLMSSILSNMHQHQDHIMRSCPAKLLETRRTYADMLRQMMQAMKANYQEIQSNGRSDSADPGAQGDYVGFVQQVVSFLQQYTSDICPIDRFFTDSSAFPLPEEDPTYVVGRLKGYVPKLSASNKRKELSVFVQTVSERAAVDGMQGYLVDQLTAAMTGVLERGDPRAPSLRHVLMTAVFPAYLENTFSTACSWILALPILEACRQTIPDLLYHVRMEDEDSLQAALNTTVVPTGCMLRSIQTVLAYPGQLMFTHVLATLTTIFETVQQSLSAVQHIARGRQDQYMAQMATNFDQCASAIKDLLSEGEFADLPEAFVDDRVEQSHWLDTREFSRKQFRDNMNGWHARDGQYFVRRGAGSVEVVVRLKDQAEEKQRLLESLHRYQQSYEVVFKGQKVRGTVSATDEVVV